MGEAYSNPEADCGTRPERHLLSQFRVRARARQIFRVIEGQPGTTQIRSAATIADMLEDRIRASGWIPGQFMGTETALASTFEVGRRSIRQAGRILAARGALEIRRGSTGGFLVSSVDQDAAIGALSAALGDIANLAHVANEARAMLPDALLAGRGPGASLVWASLQQLGAAAGPAIATHHPKDDTRAQRITFAIAREFCPGPDAAEDARIGSLDDLCERFSCGLPVMIQAVRILEDHGIATSKRGRSGGIVLRAAGASLAMRVVSAHLSSHHADIAECDQIVRATTAAAIELAHTRFSSGAAGRLDEHLARMEGSVTSTELGMHWYLLQRALCDTGANPVLHLLARCFAGHVILHRTRAADLDDSQARALMAASRTIVANIKKGTPRSSRDAHLRCQAAMMRSW